MFFPACAGAANFSSGVGTAVRFGVHEIELSGQGSSGNPFDVIVTVTFVPPSGEAAARTVEAFYDGGQVWRARVYVGEVGAWHWRSRCASNSGLDGKSGTFTAGDSGLRGRLLVHRDNPRQWMTEDGRWFLNLNDTAYFLLNEHAGNGDPISNADAAEYVRDIVARGITSVRGFTLFGPGGFLDDSVDFRKRWSSHVFADERFEHLNLESFRVTDGRLRWLLDAHPDLYVQFILLPRGSQYARDDEMWASFSPEQKNRVLRHLIARFSAYPQLFWLVTNDAHYGEKFPHNTAMAREVGDYFLRHDPWRHPFATGPARGRGYPFADEAWSTYIHLEDNYAVGAAPAVRYHASAKPVFLGEDRYEQDRPELDPQDMRYFQRRLFWSWLLSGASANYGGRWWVLHPYARTGSLEAPSPWRVIGGGEAAKSEPVATHRGRLAGLDSVKAIRDFFEERRIDLSAFAPAPGLARDVHDGAGTTGPFVMRRGDDEFLAYLPNATSNDRSQRSDPDRTASMVFDLTTVVGRFTVEWYRAEDGRSEPGGVIPGGSPVRLMAPWRGHDGVVRLVRVAE